MLNLTVWHFDSGNDDYSGDSKNGDIDGVINRDYTCSDIWIDNTDECMK